MRRTKRKTMLRYAVGALVMGLGVGPVAVAAPAVATGIPTPVPPVRSEASTPADAVRSKSVAAGCPDGMAVFGAGGLVSEAAGGVVLTGIVPDAGLTAVTVSAVARPGASADWRLTAYAVCHARGGQAPVRTSGLGVGGDATASCPAGKVLYG